MAIELVEQAGEVLLDPSNKVQVDVQNVNGDLKVNVRHWYLGNSGEWIPTKKGFMLTPVEARNLGDVLSQMKV